MIAPENFTSFIKNGLIFLAIFLAFYFVGYLLRKIIRKKLRQDFAPKEIVTFISDLIFYASLILGLTVGLANIGVNMNAIIASFGLGGFALGFALKDILANFVSGFLIILSKTFSVGDYLKMGTTEGEIKAINLRHTVLASKENPKQRILIPNSNVFSSVIIIEKKKS
ncbi:MAG: mechanosensitive ion channel family protein [Microgenomates group bacterium]